MDTVEITLPISGVKVELRNYTTVADDERAEQLLYQGVELDQKTQANSDGSIKFPLANIIASQKSYIPRLVKSIDGDSSSIAIRLTELRSLDYQAITEAVEAITEANSPKAKGATKASKPATN